MTGLSGFRKLSKHAEHDQKLHGIWARGRGDSTSIALQNTVGTGTSSLRFVGPGDTETQLGLNRVDQDTQRLLEIVSGAGLSRDYAATRKVQLLRQKLVAAAMKEAGVTEDDASHFVKAIKDALAPADLSVFMTDIESDYFERQFNPDGLDPITFIVEGMRSSWGLNSESLFPVGLKMVAEKKLGAVGEVKDRVKENVKFWKRVLKDERVSKVFEAFVQAQYDETQAVLKGLGLKHVMLVRGVYSEDAGVNGQKLQEINIEHRALSSFSSQPRTAETFGDTFLLHRVPIEDIFSIGELGGVGTAAETEFVVINRKGTKSVVVPKPRSFSGVPFGERMQLLQEELDRLSVPGATISKANIPNDPKLYARVKAEAKRKFDVYPSAYANGWLVQEYKRRGGTYRTVEKAEGGLSRWFEERWVDLSRPKEGGGYEDCGRPDADEGKYPKCVPASRAARMSEDEIKSAVRRKRQAESKQQREGKKPIYVSTDRPVSKHAEHDQKSHGSWARGRGDSAPIALNNINPFNYGSFDTSTPVAAAAPDEKNQLIIRAAQNVANYLISQGITEKEMASAGLDIEYEYLEGIENASPHVRGIVQLMTSWAQWSGSSPKLAKLRRAVVEELGGHQDEASQIAYGQELWGGEWDSIKRPWLLIARAMYNETQRIYKEVGVTHVLLYRGVERPDGKTALGDLITGTPSGGYREFEYFGSTISSFSRNPGTALGFSRYVIASRVPVENIFSTSSTGLGTSAEAEHVVINRRGGDSAIIIRPSTYVPNDNEPDYKNEENKWLHDLAHIEEVVVSAGLKPTGLSKHYEHDQRSHGNWARYRAEDQRAMLAEMDVASQFKKKPGTGISGAGPVRGESLLSPEYPGESQMVPKVKVDENGIAVIPSLSEAKTKWGSTLKDVRQKVLDEFNVKIVDGVVDQILNPEEEIALKYRTALAIADALESVKASVGPQTWEAISGPIQDQDGLTVYLGDTPNPNALGSYLPVTTKNPAYDAGTINISYARSRNYVNRAYLDGLDQNWSQYTRALVESGIQSREQSFHALVYALTIHEIGHAINVRSINAGQGNRLLPLSVKRDDFAADKDTLKPPSPGVPVPEYRRTFENTQPGVSTYAGTNTLEQYAEAFAFWMLYGQSTRAADLTKRRQNRNYRGFVRDVLPEIMKSAAMIEDTPETMPSVMSWFRYQMEKMASGVRKHYDHDQRTHGNWARYRAEDQRAMLAEMDRAGVPLDSMKRRKGGTGLSGARGKSKDEQGGQFKGLDLIKRDSNGVAVQLTADEAAAKYGSTQDEVMKYIEKKHGIKVKKARNWSANVSPERGLAIAHGIAEALDMVKTAVTPEVFTAISDNISSIKLVAKGRGESGSYFPTISPLVRQLIVGTRTPEQGLLTVVSDGIRSFELAGLQEQFLITAGKELSPWLGNTGELYNPVASTKDTYSIVKAIALSTTVHEIGHVIDFNVKGMADDRYEPSIRSAWNLIIEGRIRRIPLPDNSDWSLASFGRGQDAPSKYGSGNDWEMVAETFASLVLFGKDMKLVKERNRKYYESMSGMAGVFPTEDYGTFVQQKLRELVIKLASNIICTPATMPSVLLYAQYQAEKAQRGVRKHYDHDQRSHGNWARYRAEDQRAILAEMDRAGVPLDSMKRRKGGTGVSGARGKPKDEPGGQFKGLDLIKRDSNGVAVQLTADEAAAKYGSTDAQVMRYIEKTHGIKVSETIGWSQNVNHERALAIAHGVAEALDMVKTAVTPEVFANVTKMISRVTLEDVGAGEAGAYIPPDIALTKWLVGNRTWPNPGNLRIISNGIQKFEISSLMGQMSSVMPELGYTPSPRVGNVGDVYFPQGNSSKDRYSSVKAIALSTMVHEIGHVIDFNVKGMADERYGKGGLDWNDWDAIMDGTIRRVPSPGLSSRWGSDAPSVYGSGNDWEMVAETFASLVLFGKDMKVVKERNRKYYETMMGGKEWQTKVFPTEDYGTYVQQKLRELVIKLDASIICTPATMPSVLLYAQYQAEKAQRGVRKHYDHDQRSHGNWARGSGRGAGITALRSQSIELRSELSWLPINDEIKAYLKDKFKVVIPPGYTDVRVHSDWRNGGDGRVVMATDAKGRSVSMYTKQYQEQQKEQKYGRVLALSKVIGKLDSALDRDAMTDDTAAAVLLMRELGMRPGSMQDTKAAKQAYGATTLQARHVFLSPTTKTVRFTFVGKKGVNISISTRNPKIWEAISSRMEGKSGKDRLFDTTEGQTLSYVKQHAGSEFMQKDLRTLKAYTMAMKMVTSMRRPTTLAAFKKARLKIGDAVSKQLGNTRAESLASYIPEFVFDSWLDKLGQDGQDWRDGVKR